MAEAPDTFSDLDLSDPDSEEETLELNKEFKAAANYMKVLVSKLNSAKLLEIYAYYKQALEGPCNVARPKWYEVQAKQKWDAWNALGDLSSTTAKEKYISIITELAPDWNSKTNELPKSNSQHWVTVSRMQQATEEEFDDDNTIYDYCKDGNVMQVEMMLNLSPANLNELDDNGLALIHWAADRGYLDMIKLLMQFKCDLSLRDESGQTALHYAASCGHTQCVKLLLESGINRNIRDNDGMSAADVASDDSIKTLFVV